VGKKTTMRLLNRLWSVEYGKIDVIKKLDLPLEAGVTLVASRWVALGLGTFIRIFKGAV
jgi:hypothetical protein